MLVGLFVLPVLPARATGIPAAVAEDPLFEDAEGAALAFPDPLEPSNRCIFMLNRRIDRWILDPLARAYACVVPRVARRAVLRVLANLDSPAIFVNDVLQIAPRDATVTAGRFVLNTTIGLLGVLDPAARIGLERHETDFGHTLAVYRLPSGAYLVLPIVGPSTARDAFGTLVDFLFRPTTYLLTPGAQIVFTSITAGSTGVAERDAHAAELHALEASSLDFYATLRSAYYQDRVAGIAARRARSWVPVAIGPSSAAPATLAGGEVTDLPPDARDERLEALPGHD